MKRSWQRLFYAIPIALAGVLLGHAFVYQAVFPVATHRHDALQSTGHGYLPFFTVIAVIAGLYSLWHAIRLGRQAAQATHKQAAIPFHYLVLSLFLIQALCFVGLEVTERLFSTGLRGALAFLGSPLLSLGIIFQLITATILGFALSGATHVGKLLTKVRRLPFRTVIYNLFQITIICRSLPLSLSIRAPPRMRHT